MAHAAARASNAISSLPVRESLAAARRVRLPKSKGKSSNASAAEDSNPPKNGLLFGNAARLLAVSVRTVVDTPAPVAIEFGSNAAVTPAGKPLTDRLTG
jgi:hypothetical protein